MMEHNTICSFFYFLSIIFFSSYRVLGFTSQAPNGVLEGKVSVVSFDLDDTFWPTEAVVNKANLQIKKIYGVEPDAVHNKMKEIRKREAIKLSYSKMRTMAYQELGLNGDAENAFSAWVQARNTAAEEELFPDVLKCLKEFHEAGWLICAITNGRGSTLQIPSLAPFFSVEVSGEDEEIFPNRKPAAEIFEATIKKLNEETGWNGDVKNWYHVGDCSVNDVMGASNAGMKTILLARNTSDEEQGEESTVKFYSTMTSKEKAERDSLSADAKPDLVCSSLSGLLESISLAHRTEDADELLITSYPQSSAPKINKFNWFRRLAQIVLTRPLQKKKEQVVRQYFDGVTQKNLEQIAGCFADSVELIDVCGPSKGKPRYATNEQMAERVAEFVAAHPDCVVDFHHPPVCSRSGSDSNWVWSHWFEVGSWSGKSLGIAPTGEPLTVEGHTRFLVNDDFKITKVVVTRTFSDWEIQSAKGNAAGKEEPKSTENESKPPTYTSLHTPNTKINTLKKVTQNIVKRSQKQKEEVVRQYFEGINQKNFEKITDCFADSVELVDVCGPSKGKPTYATNVQMAERVAEFVAAHPDCVVDFHHPPVCSRSGSRSNWVWCHWFKVGSWSGESLGIAPTGEPLKVEGHTRFLVNDDFKITKLVVTRTFSVWETQAAKLIAAGKKQLSAVVRK